MKRAFIAVVVVFQLLCLSACTNTPSQKENFKQMPLGLMEYYNGWIYYESYDRGVWRTKEDTSVTELFNADATLYDIDQNNLVYWDKGIVYTMNLDTSKTQPLAFKICCEKYHDYYLTADENLKLYNASCKYLATVTNQPSSHNFLDNNLYYVNMDSTVVNKYNLKTKKNEVFYDFKNYFTEDHYIGISFDERNILVQNGDKTIIINVDSKEVQEIDFHKQRAIRDYGDDGIGFIYSFCDDTNYYFRISSNGEFTESHYFMVNKKTLTISETSKFDITGKYLYLKGWVYNIDYYDGVTKGLVRTKIN